MKLLVRDQVHSTSTYAEDVVCVGQGVQLTTYVDVSLLST